MKKTFQFVAMLFFLAMFYGISYADESIVSIKEGTSFTNAPSVYLATIYQSTGISGDETTKSGYFCIH